MSQNFLDAQLQKLDFAQNLVVSTKISEQSENFQN